MEFSPTLAKAMREQLDLNRVEAAKRIGLSRQGLINIEDGESVPSANTVGLMAVAYSAEVGDFFIAPDAATPDEARGSQPKTTEAPTSPPAVAAATTG